VEEVSEKACPRTWTCEVRLRERTLPDPEVFAARFRDSHVGARVRGVEAEVRGLLEEGEGGLRLKPAGGGEPVLLVPLASKVQWDVRGGREEPATEAERTAHGRLRREKDRSVSGTLVTVRGPLRKGPASLELEVRSFQPMGKGGEGP
jgi:hypothetical protein